MLIYAFLFIFLLKVIEKVGKGEFGLVEKIKLQNVKIEIFISN